MSNTVKPQLQRHSDLASPVEVATFRLGIFDVCDDTVPVRFLGRVFGDSQDDRDVMELAIREYGELIACREGCTYAMAAFRDYPPPTEVDLALYLPQKPSTPGVIRTRDRRIRNPIRGFRRCADVIFCEVSRSLYRGSNSVFGTLAGTPARAPRRHLPFLAGHRTSSSSRFVDVSLVVAK